jgi:radical SAM superfamily enzyme YgiQ (UPF0313 family)
LCPHLSQINGMRADNHKNPPRGKGGRIKPGKLRVALVFPPVMPPTSPPLGIAVLKSYLQSAANVEVRNFDLNLACFEQAFKWLGDGRLRMRIHKMDFEATAQKAVGARDFFCGKQDVRRFFDQALYNEHAGIYAGFSSVLNGLFDNFARKIVLGTPTSPLVNRFFDELIEPLINFRPHLAGFSILFSQQLFFALALAKMCSLRSGLESRAAGRGSRAGGGEPPRPKIVFGGATFSVMPGPSRLLDSIPVYLAGKPNEVNTGRFIDCLIVGEGEKGLESLVKLLLSPQTASKAPPEAAPNMSAAESAAWCRRPKAAAIMAGGPGSQAPPVMDLNSLPLPDFSDFPLDKYHSPVPVLPYLSSRGCPWRRCAFCTHQKTYLHYREEGAATTAERLSALKEKYDVSHFCLVDEMVHPRRMDGIASQIIRRGAQVRFSAYARPARFSLSVIEKAHGAGLRVLMWGLESASQRLLDLMCKGTKAEEIAAILDSARKAGVWNLLFLIFGFPTETKAEWLNTLDFVDSCRESIHALSRSRFILLAGSDVFANPERYGIKRIIDRPKRDPVSIAYDYEAKEGLTREEITVMLRESSARLSGIGRSPWFGQFRDHMLIFASNEC